MNSSSLSILVIEDQNDIAGNIIDYFEGKGHKVDYARNGQHGLELLQQDYFDVVILDVMMPGLDGLQVCQIIRHKVSRHIPVIMLTARDTLDDKVNGFQVGADDYLCKPFMLEELEVRCIALARRLVREFDSTLTVGPVEIDKGCRKVFRDKREIRLNSMAFNILVILAEEYPRIVSRTQLSAKLWGDNPTESDSLRSHLYQLRQALDKPFPEPLIHTIHGVGFSLKVNE